jgi:hypothetical protein
MKIYLASYFEPENHGPGRKIGISPSKPKTLLADKGYECDFAYHALSPGDAYWDYHKARKAAGDDKEKLEAAGSDFRTSYKKTLDDFAHKVKEASVSGDSVFKIIGLEDGDTLLSWENKGHMTYRNMTAECLRSLGYEVQEN